MALDTATVNAATLKEAICPSCSEGLLFLEIGGSVRPLVPGAVDRRAADQPFSNPQTPTAYEQEALYAEGAGWTEDEHKGKFIAVLNPDGTPHKFYQILGNDAERLKIRGNWVNFTEPEDPSLSPTSPFDGEIPDFCIVEHWNRRKRTPQSPKDVLWDNRILVCKSCGTEFLVP